MQLDGLGSMTSYLQAQARLATAKYRTPEYLAQIADTPANRAKILPANGFWNISFAPQFQISKASFDALKAGKTIYVWNRAYFPGSGQNPAATAHYMLPVAQRLWVNDVYAKNPNITLAQINQIGGQLSAQNAQAGRGMTFTEALTAAAAFVAIGATVGAAAGAIGGSAAATTGAGAGTGVGTAVTTTAPYAEAGYTGTAVVAPASYGAVGTAAQAAGAAAEDAGYAAAVSATPSASLLTQVGNYLGSQIPTTDSLITSAETAAGTKATKLITSFMSPPAPAAPLSPAAPSLSTIPANAPAPTKSLTSTIMPLILGGLSLLAFLK